MTRLGIISDIHANLEALDAVLATLDAAGVERIVCLGDIVGYGASPNECIAKVRATCDVVLGGNHDRGAVGGLPDREFPPLARRALVWTRRVLDPAHAAYLRTLDCYTPLDEERCAVHGMLVPEPNDRYHMKESHVAPNLAALARRGMRVCLFGHTHRPVVHAEGGSTLVGRTTVGLARAGRYLINPGSVGQSRDADPRAACAILDDERVEFLRVDYDRERFAARVAAAGFATERPSPVRWLARCLQQ